MQTKKWLLVAALVVSAGACELDPGGVEAGVARPIGPLPGPAVTVTARADGLAVSWSDLAAVTYNVLRGVNGGAAALVAAVAGPTTSYVDTDVVAGSTYCYQVLGLFEGGATTALSAAVCAATSGGGGPGAVTITIPLPASTARAGGASPGAVLQSGVTSWLVQSTGELVYPLPVLVGDTITGFRVWGNKQSGTGTRLAATLMTVGSSGSASGSATASNQLSAPGAFALVVTGASVAVTPGSSYIIEADSTTGVALDLWTAAEVTVSRPRM